MDFFQHKNEQNKSIERKYNNMETFHIVVFDWPFI